MAGIRRIKALAGIRRIKALACLLPVLLFLPGCTVDGREVVLTLGSGMYSVFKMGPLRCSDAEVRVYMANYGNIYGNFGSTSLWQGDFDTARMEESIRNLVVQHLARVYSMNLYAQEHDIDLDEKELAQVKLAAEDYYSSLSEEEKAYMNISARDIEKMYRQYALAEKVYFGLMDSIDEEISEDEARVIDAYVLYTTREAAADEVDKGLAEGVSFERLCANYSEGEKGAVSFGRGTYSPEVEGRAFEMDDGECSGRISAGDGFYYIFCIKKYNRELSEQNKERIVGERKKKAIEDIITAQGQNYYSSFNKKRLDGIAFMKGKEVTTDSFFKTLDSYLSY